VQLTEMNMMCAFYSTSSDLSSVTIINSHNSHNKHSLSVPYHSTTDKRTFKTKKKEIEQQ